MLGEGRTGLLTQLHLWRLCSRYGSRGGQRCRALTMWWATRCLVTSRCVAGVWVLGAGAEVW